MSSALTPNLAVAVTYICQEDESSSLLICRLLRDDPKARYGEEESYDRKDHRVLWKPTEDNISSCLWSDFPFQAHRVYTATATAAPRLSLQHTP
jgi:hypothetical protein